MWHTYRLYCVFKNGHYGLLAPAHSAYQAQFFFEELRILSFMSLRSYKICITINNIIQTNSPLPSSIFFFPNRDTRHAFNLNFNLPKCSNLYGERLIQFAGAKVWNELPIEIKVARDFDMSCKLYYLSNQTERWNVLLLLRDCSFFFVFLFFFVFPLWFGLWNVCFLQRIVQLHKYESVVVRIWYSVFLSNTLCLHVKDMLHVSVACFSPCT